MKRAPSASFVERLRAAWHSRDSLVCVGLDPELERLPAALGREHESIYRFNCAVIDATADLVCAYKPQIAHYAAVGAERELERTIAYVHAVHPDIPVLLDAKRGDVGHTAERYAIEAFERYGADAVTVNPYLGSDSLAPFLKYRDRGVFVVCRTSNAGARDLQDLETGGGRLFEAVARLAATAWNEHGNCGLVVGATYPRDLAAVRAIVDDMPLLLPGVGAQGGDVAAAVTSGRTARGDGLLVSSSRAILYASGGADFAAAARLATQALRGDINRHRGPPTQ
ncbi:MAG TPA: orotidine-5'-phosphate decarboxylase [Steroidobacteraceae bacterium]